MKNTLRIVGRVFAVIFGAAIVYVQLSNFSKLPFPSYAQAVGFDIAWVAILFLGLLALFYGLGIRISRAKAKTNG